MRAIVDGVSTFDGQEGLNEVEVALFMFVDGRGLVSKEAEEIEPVVWVLERNGAALVLIVVPPNVDDEVSPDQGCKLCDVLLDAIGGVEAPEMH